MTLAELFVILAAAVLFVGGIVVLGIGAWTWARAFAEVQRGRVHRQSADANDETLQAAAEANDELAARRVRVERDLHEAPTDDELMRQVLEERREYTTFSNENVEEDSGITPDRPFVEAEA